MAEPVNKLPINTEAPPATQPAKTTDWQPFETLRNQIDRLFHDFQTGFLQAPLPTGRSSTWSRSGVAI